MSPHPLSSLSARRRAIAGPLAILGLAASLTACKIDDGAQDPQSSFDYHTHYPIVLSQAPTTLDVFTADGALDAQSLANIKEFVDRYHRFGAGRIAILAPSNRRNSPAVADVRKALYGYGVRGSISVGSYPNPNGSDAAPFRLLYDGLVAKVPAPCGDFPEDLASGDNYHEWQNLPYNNFGCSTQKMLASQIDDPRDLARARANGDGDSDMRLRGIQAVRQGQDPGTSWKVQNTTIGQVGGS
jgi:pilus assembly protein CpaD